MQITHTKKIKIFHNLHYCFICVYDVDHPRNTCTVADTAYHMSNILRDKAHIYDNQVSSMVAQNK